MEENREFSCTYLDLGRLYVYTKSFEFLLILDVDESRQASDLIFGCDLVSLINVHLEEDNFVLQFLCQLHKPGSKRPTWTTPCRIEVDDDQFVSGGFQLSLEVSLRKSKESINQHATKITLKIQLTLLVT